MKRETKDKIVITLLIAQSVLFIFIPLRIVVILTLTTTCLLYCDIKGTGKRLLGVFTYCLLVFLLFSLYFRELRPLNFLGFTFENSCTEDLFFDSNGALYFAIIPTNSSNIVNETYKQAYSQGCCALSTENRLSSIINFDKFKAYENTCIINNENVFVYINGKNNSYEEYRHDLYKSTVDNLKRKQTILQQTLGNSDDLVLFSVCIPECDEFWSEYKVLKDKFDMMKYIIANVGFRSDLWNSRFEFAVFYADESCGFAKFRHKNHLRVNVY